MRSTAPSLVIFDCDGVLVDSERLSHEVLMAMLAEQGVVLTLPQALAHFMGTSMARCLQVIEQLLGRPAPADFVEQFRVRSFDAFSRELTVVPGVIEVLDQLDRAGVAYGVASNGPRAKMEVTLGHTQLLPRLRRRMFSADDVRHPKPAPDLFLLAAQSLGAAPADCVVVEDSPTGVTAARAAGMQVYGYTAMTPVDRLRDAGAHAWFDDMAQLPALLAMQASPQATKAS